MMEYEILIYPLTSLVSSLKSIESITLNFNFLVADFGRILGLFLGFSFMTLWDGLNFLFISMDMIKTLLFLRSK